MIRRKLFAYTMMMVAGILAGYFICERCRFFRSVLLMLIIGLAVCLMTHLEAAHGHPRVPSFDPARQTMILVACMLSGTLMFTARFVSYESEVLPEPYGSALAAGDRTQVLLQGKISSLQLRTDRLVLTVTDAGIIPGDEGPAGETDSIVPLKHDVRATFYAENDRYSGKSDQEQQSQKPLKSQQLADPEAEQAEPHTQISLPEGVTDIADLIGARIILSGKLRSAPGPDNPGCFNYRTYLRGRGINYLMTITHMEVPEAASHQGRHDEIGADSEPGLLKDAALSWHEVQREGAVSAWTRLRRFLFRSREEFLNSFEDEETRAFIKGVVFGDKGDIDDEVRLDFDINATGHILAVSGLHIGFLYALLRLATGRRKSAFLTGVIIATLIMYGEMTMWSSSTIRAVLVLSISMMAMYVKRPFDLLTSVSAAAVLILVHEPYQLFDSGFQMSFMALIGISFLAKPLGTILGRDSIAGESLSVILAVQAGSLPVSAWTFHRLNFLSIFINIPIITVASVLVPICITTLFFSMATGLNLPIAADLISAVSELIIRLNELLTFNGAFSNLVISVNPGLICCLCMSVLLISSEWMRVRYFRREKGKAIAALLCVIAVTGGIGACGVNDFARADVVFVSVGQGDCVHVKASGNNALIDGGGSTERNVGQTVLMPYLLANRASSVDIAMVTHLHTDHYRGIAELAQVYPVGAVGIPEDYRRSLEEDAHGLTNAVYLRKGSEIRLGDDARVEPIWPLPGASGDISIDDPNEHNMVYMVHYQGIKIMVTGDLLEEDELAMVRHYAGTDTLKCDILKVGHHGSKSSSSAPFLDAAAPEIAVIQVGRGNMYGHPHAETLAKLEERGIEVYRTDLNGAVGIDIQNGKIKRIVTMR